MGMVFIIVGGLMLVVMGLWGLRRGVQRGLLTLVGTLMGAVLIDLWGSTWNTWVREQFQPENPGNLIWLMVSGVFLLVALLIGYGSSMLLPRPAPKAQLKKLSFQDRLMGGLVGVLNGALIIGYLLRYAFDLAPDSGFVTAAQETVALQLLHDWLPWFILATVISVGALVLFRTALRLASLASQPAPAEASKPTQVAGAQNKADALQAISNKIDQVMNEGSRK